MKKLFIIFVVLVASSCLWAQNNVITYTATEKLSKTTSMHTGGLHLEAFNVAIKKHTFSNGQGVITFSGDVTSIGDYAFYECTSLTSIIIPNSVTSIGEKAFAKCYSLTSITIPNSVKNIGTGAFEDCNRLTTVTISNSVISIGDYAFKGCTGLTSIEIPNSIRCIGASAFEDCIGLTSIEIPNSLNNVITYTATQQLPQTMDSWSAGIYTEAFNVTIKKHTFSNGQGTIIFSGEVTNIGDYAFFHCYSLTSIKIPNSVTSIGDNTFEDCTELISIMIPDSVTSIGNYAFSDCIGLTSIEIPNSVKSIGAGAFSDCTGLTSVKIPNIVTKIEHHAFSNCTRLTSIEIPISTIEIGRYAFLGCTGLTLLRLHNSKTSIDDYAFSGCKSLVVHVPQESLSRFQQEKALSDFTVIGDADVLPINPAQPPLLVLVDNSLQLMEQNANNTIDANENCKIRFQLTNKGKGAAVGCQAKIVGKGSTTGLTFATQKLPSIAVGATYTVEIPITASLNTTDGTVSFSIEVTEPNGYGIDSMTLTVNTRAFDAPMLEIVDYAVSGSGTIQKKQPFDLQLLLQNTQYGKAEDVDVTISIPAGVSLWEGTEKTHYAVLNGGAQQQLNYQLAISGNYASTTVPINVTIKEKYGKFSENKTITLALNQQLAGATSVTLQGQQPQVQRDAITIGALGSAVDRNIPTTNVVNKNTFVVIIANENYMSVASVPYALNDGLKFREYCHKTLGIPEKNIRYIANATGNQMKAQVQWLENITNVFDNPNIVFYYAGHGIPDEKNETSYLLPVDGIGTDVTTGYKLDELYAVLGQMPSAHTTVFLDACFSGSKREEGMLAAARGIAIKAKAGVPQGNMVVFSAAQGKETAYPNKEEGHGMFTYYLLKKLQESGGDVTLYDLGNYITTNVSQQSILLNGKSQTPCVTAAAGLGEDWQLWKLK